MFEELVIEAAKLALDEIPETGKPNEEDNKKLGMLARGTVAFLTQPLDDAAKLAAMILSMLRAAYYVGYRRGQSDVLFISPRGDGEDK